MQWTVMRSMVKRGAYLHMQSETMIILALSTILVVVHLFSQALATCRLLQFYIFGMSDYLRVFLPSINQIMVGQTICPDRPLHSTSCSSSWGLWNMDTCKWMSSTCQKAYPTKVSKRMRRCWRELRILWLLIDNNISQVEDVIHQSSWVVSW